MAENYDNIIRKEERKCKMTDKETKAINEQAKAGEEAEERKEAEIPEEELDDYDDDEEDEE